MKGKGLTGKRFNGERTKDFELDQRTVFSADSHLLWKKGRRIPTERSIADLDSIKGSESKVNVQSGKKVG
jgi:hypothetical protein